MGGSLELSALDREKVTQWIAAHGTPQQVALRCRIVLSSAQGESDVAIARSWAADGEPQHGDPVAKVFC